MTATEKAALERRIDELCAEVERLRQIADGAANEADRLTHDAAALQIENAKLRELVCWMYDRMDESCAAHYTYAPAPISYDLLMQALSRVRELGIEVD